MSNQSDQESVGAEAGRASEEAVEQGENIRELVRDITLQALSRGSLDTDKIRGVVRSVVSGAGRAAEASANPPEERVREALAGVDEALAKSAQASRLAIEEALGRVEEFGDQEFRRALQDLKTLEELFLKTVKDVASSSGQRFRETAEDFVRHARVSGTAVGKAAAESVDTLGRGFGESLLSTASGGAETALRVGARLSEAAAGFLDGLAASLKERGRKQ